MLSHSLQVQCQATFHKGQCYSRPSPKSSRFTQLSGDSAEYICNDVPCATALHHHICCVAGPSRHQLPGRSVLVHGAGEDAVQGWIDLAQLVSSAGGVKGAYEKLANKIGMPLRCIVVPAGCPGSNLVCLQQPLVCVSLHCRLPASSSLSGICGRKISQFARTSR